ncbi:MAG: methyltransferase domain-containing protein [Thermoplasmata archaeon]|nr:methyltransferase domain-containing protein [Thermoplasmata archaeon]
MSGPWNESADRMVEALGPIPTAVAKALRSVPRHLFVPREYLARSYDDEPIPLGSDFTSISAPHMVALQLELARLRRGSSLLEIGSGSGYLLAVAAAIVGPSAHLVGVEVDPGLANRSRATLAQLGVDATIRIRDGRESVPEGAVFDAVIVSCATPVLHPAWPAALVDGGRVVAPVGDAMGQTLTVYRRKGAKGTSEAGPAVRFVPLRASVPPHI